MSYNARDYSSLLGMEGFSDTLLNDHFELYRGYVKNTNKLLSDLSAMLDKDETGTPQYAELKRRLGWEFNGMRLHEYYFENLGASDFSASSKLAARINEDFGTFEKWMTDFKSTGAMRGIGWAVLYEDSNTGKLINFWINEHDLGHPAGCRPLLVMDVFEHAYMTDYGIKRAAYVEAFFKNINWNVVEGRLAGAGQAQKAA